MNNVEFNHYHNLKLCDSHWHLSMPHALQDTVRTFREMMAYFVLDRVGLMTLVNTSNRYDPAANLKAFYIKDVLNHEKADSVFAYGCLNQTYDARDTEEGFLTQVKTLCGMGVDGFKFLDGKPNMRKRSGRSLDHSIYEKAYAYLEEKSIPVMMHVADPPYFWNDISRLTSCGIDRSNFLGNDPSCTTFEQLHRELNGLLTKFPKLHICVAHFGGYLSNDLDALTTFLERWEHVSIDLTPGPFNFVEISKNRDAWTTFFKTYRKRIFFGTDTYNTLMEGDDLTKYEAPHVRGNLVRHALEKNAEDAFDIPLGKVIPLNLEDDVLSDIYFGNHKRLHPHPRPLNRELIAEQAEILLCDLKSGKEKLWTEEEQKLETENAAVVLSHFKK